MAHDSRTGCLAGSDRSGLASGRLAGRLVSGRLVFWARLALVVLLGLLAGLGVAWVSARRPEWRPVAVFALVGSAGLVLLVRRYWPQWLWRYTGFVLLGLGWLTARRWGASVSWEVFLASAMLYGLGLGVWDAVRERRGSRKCFHAASGCGCVGSVGGYRSGTQSQSSTGSEQVSTSPDNRNALVGCGHSCVVCNLRGGNVRLEPTQPCDDRDASVAELAEAEHRLRVERRRLELLRPLSEESNRITDEILRLYKLSDEELLAETSDGSDSAFNAALRRYRDKTATIRELREKLETAEAEWRVLEEAYDLAKTRANAAEAELAKWRSGALRLGTRKSHTDDEHSKADCGTEDGQRQVAGQAGEGSASEGEPRAMLRSHCASIECDQIAVWCIRDTNEQRPDAIETLACDTHLASLIGSVEPVKPTGPWLLSPEPRPAIRQHKPSGEPVVHFDSDGQQRQLAERLAECFYGLTVEERRELLASWPTPDRTTQPVQNSDENLSELDATAGPNVSGQLDLPLWATPTAWQQATSANPSVTEAAQIQAALRQGDQDIAANRGHDLGEVLADLDGKPSPAQLAPKPHLTTVQPTTPTTHNAPEQEGRKIITQ